MHGEQGAPGSSLMFRRAAVGCLTVVAVLAIAGVVLFATVRPFRAAVTTLALVPELLDQGPQLLTAIAPAPSVRRIGYGAIRRDRADIYLPGGGSAPERGGQRDRPAVVLVLGVNQVALEHPAVVRTATALARAGFVVAVPEDAELAAGHVRPGAVDHLLDAFEAVSAQPEVDPTRIGLAGFSAGGSIALIAAADPRIAERVAWVNAFGAYGDAATLLVDIASRTVAVDGRVTPWRPGELARRASLELILSAIDDPSARARLRSAVEDAILAGGAPPAFDPAVAAGLAGDARVAYGLLTATSRQAAASAIAGLSVEASATLDELSPVTVAERVTAPVFLMHDVGDDAIPFSQLAPLAAALPPASLRAATAFELFDHVQPDAGGLGIAQLPDLWRLFTHLQALLEIAA